MRFLILDTYYSEVLHQVYAAQPGLKLRSYAEQMQAIYDVGFARVDFLPRNLRALGHVAEQIICNAEAAQAKWAEEQGLLLSHVPLEMRKLAHRFERGIRRLGLVTRLELNWLVRIVAAQVEAFDPDVIFACDLLQFPAAFWRRIKGKNRRLVGECAYPLPENVDLQPFDMLVSAAPHFVERFRREGARAELLRLGFEPSVLEKLGPAPTQDGIVFIGSISAAHNRRINILEAVCRFVPSVRCWGRVEFPLSSDSPLRGRIQPPLWGYEMYRQLQRAKATLNIHIDVAENLAGNMRLYEATGVGTMLITDSKANLADMFELGREVVAYQTPEECAELVLHFLEHELERAAIAMAGQKRTLREHTYKQRMEQLVEMVKPLFRVRTAVGRVN